MHCKREKSTMKWTVLRGGSNQLPEFDDGSITLAAFKDCTIRQPVLVCGIKLLPVMDNGTIVLVVLGPSTIQR